MNDERNKDMDAAARQKTDDTAERKPELPKFDAGYKQELSKPPQFIHFLQKYVKADWCMTLTPEQVKLCDKEFTLEDYQKRIADLVYKIRLHETDLYVYLIMELQSTVDFTMPFRLLTLIFGLLLKIFLETPENEREKKEFRLPVVLPILFYNGEHSWSAETEFRKYMKEYQLIKRMEELGESDRISFQKWLEYVLLASTSGENQEAVKQLIEVIRQGKGDAKMIHGIQVIIRDEYNRGVNEGRTEGEILKLIQQICRKLRKGKTAAFIADELEEDISVILPLCEIAQNYGPDYDEKSVFDTVMKAHESQNQTEKAEEN